MTRKQKQLFILFALGSVIYGTAAFAVEIPRSLWTATLRTAVSGLSVRINNFDPSKSQPLSCGHPAPCPWVYRAMIHNDSVIDYRPSLPGAGAPFHSRFTPQDIWRRPFLFLMNDINLIPRRIGVRADCGRIVLDLPFESEGREVVSVCHDNAFCGWGPPDGNNKPNAEVDDLVIHIPFVISVDTSRPSNRIRVALGDVDFDAAIRRAGACHKNALAVICDIFGGDVEGKIREGLKSALNSFVASSDPVISRLEAGVNAAMCQFARANGYDCNRVTQILVEPNGDIMMVF